MVRKNGLGWIRSCFIATAAGVAMLTCIGQSNAALLSSWTLETNTPADVTNSATGPAVASEAGIFPGTLTGVHVSANSDWTTPSGNGSANSYSANEWAVNDYFQFSSSSSGITGIKVYFDHTSSSTGPRDFTLQYSTDGTNFTNHANYSVVANSSPNAWSAGTYLPIHSYTFDLTGVAALDNQPNIFFRLAVNSTVSASGGAVASTGTSRIDNIQVPEPTSIALFVVGVLVVVRRKMFA